MVNVSVNDVVMGMSLISLFSFRHILFDFSFF